MIIYSLLTIIVSTIFFVNQNKFFQAFRWRNVFKLIEITICVNFSCITCLKRREYVRSIEICNYCKFYRHDQNRCIAINHFFCLFLCKRVFFERHCKVIEKFSNWFLFCFHDFSNLFIFMKTRFFCFKIIVKFSKHFQHIFRFFSWIFEFFRSFFNVTISFYSFSNRHRWRF